MELLFHPECSVVVLNPYSKKINRSIWVSKTALLCWIFVDQFTFVKYVLHPYVTCDIYVELPPRVTTTPLSNTSFTVNWTISDPNCNYTVTWTNLNTGMMDSYTVAENTNSHNVTGLSDNDNYNVRVTALCVCGMITRDPVTVYGTFSYTVYMYVHVCSNV